MIYIVNATFENNPPDGSMNLRVSTRPDTYLFYVEIPFAEASDDANIRSRVRDYCTGNDLPVPSDSEIVVMSRAA